MSAEREREARLAARLRAQSAPGEREALERAVALAAETAASQTLRPSRRTRTRGLLTAAAAGVAAALALTPAGAAVREWIGNGFEDAPAPSRTTLGPIPGGGELVVQSRSGPWVVQTDGSRRLLGDYDSATWSPRGLFLAVTGGRTLTAVEPDGDPRWSIDTPGEARDARWSPSGQRIAYRSGGDLRVVAGDGTVDRAIGAVAPHVAPAWMPVPDSPYSRNVLAYADTPVSLRVIDVDSGSTLMRADVPAVSSIAWLDRERLLVAAPRSLALVDARSGRVEDLTIPSGGALAAVAPSTDGLHLVLLTNRNRPEGPPQATLTLGRLGSRAGGPFSYRSLEKAHGVFPHRRLFTGLGNFQPPAFSPDGSRVLLGWRDADQWLFFDAARSGRAAKPLAIGDVSRQFDPGAPRGAAVFPRIGGWCCP